MSDHDPIAFLAGLTHDLDVWFPAPLQPHQQRLMDAMGVRVHIDPFGSRTAAP